ncbi:hypothetical protein KOSB73_250002 [Klebsiella grimontii]|uniref:Uncharacterized protein n=1 Tax=Klebsiella grimontii TaxID=2058152 RepID=A0A285B2Z3_9ENTR|nr:hypothetical protein NUITMVR1_55270 [Raoultella ornithinolytica]SNU35242.1 hypothetical protein KOSB73_250002 [Klebsiella grimontii]
MKPVDCPRPQETQSEHQTKNNRSYRSPVLNYSDGKLSELSEAGIKSTVKTWITPAKYLQIVIP